MRWFEMIGREVHSIIVKAFLYWGVHVAPEYKYLPALGS
jgi:hypothetical protein